MSDTAPATYLFLPWVRQGTAPAALAPDTLGPGMPGRAALPVRLRVNGYRDVAKNVLLYGPGDVTGLDPRIVVRTDPADGTTDFESNYLVSVEFDRADLPWMFTPASADPAGRLRPWLCLVVVPQAVAEFQAARVPLPVLRLTGPNPGCELPDLGESWAWAHAQVSGLAEGEALEEVVAARPERSVSRLLCPRRLLPDTSYHACVVPAFRAGWQAGLGMDVPAGAPLEPAWGPAGPDAGELPVYFWWSFRTGPAGDFESLVRRLVPRELPPEVGVRPMYVGAAGPGLPALAPADPGGFLGLEGALRSPQTAPSPWPDSARVPYQAALQAIVDAPGGPGGTYVVAPPIYGRWHAAASSLPAPGAAPVWVRELNLDPRHRAAASLGTRVVQEHQESLMASAWEQVGPLEEVNRLLRQAQLARAVGEKLHESTLAPMSADALLAVTGPVHTRVRMSPETLRERMARSALPPAAVSPPFRRVTRPRGPLARRLLAPGQRVLRPLVSRINARELEPAPPRSAPDGLATVGGVSDSFIPPWLPRWIADRPEWLLWLVLLLLLLFAALSLLVLRRAGFAWSTTASPPLGQVSPGAAAAVASSVLGLVAVAALVWLLRNRAALRLARRARLENATAEAVRRAAARPDFRIVPEGVLREQGPNAFRGGGNRVPRAGPDSEEGARFRAAVEAHQRRLARLLAPATAQEEVAPPLDLAAVRGTLLGRLDPGTTIEARVTSRLRLTERARPLDAGGTPVFEDALEPVLAAPEFPQPMYASLRDRSQDLLLPGLEHIPPNTVTLLETNPRFIAAYMVGLNHEMARELLWREYPTDQRGTYFRHFWDLAGRIPAPETPDERAALADIDPLHAWDRRAALENAGVRGSGARLVLLIRGEVLRRYPNAVVLAARAERRADGRRVPTREERYPLFSGTLPPDTTFLGFNLAVQEARGTPGRAEDPGWFFILQEQPTEPRFGLDAPGQELGGTPARWSDLSWGHLVPDPTALAALVHIRIAPPATGGEPPASFPHPPAVGASGVAWGANAGSMAYITLQRPVRLAVHADDMLPAPPRLTSVTPAQGPAAGGILVTLTGTNLGGVGLVTFGGMNATSFSVESATRITAVTPPHAPATVEVAVRTSGVMREMERSAPTDGATFTYF